MTCAATIPREDLDGGRPRDRVPVVFIGGSQRSGSTLLDRMMSQVPGHVSAGEVVHLWSRGLRDDELCGCGTAFHACPFWRDVGRLAFDGWDRLDPEEVVALQRRVDRNRYIFFMLFPRLFPRYRRDLTAYGRLLTPLYRAIAEAGGGVVVDSSKHVSTAFLLRRVPGIRTRVVHLVRDGRGVAFSLAKRVRRPEVANGEAFMHRQPSWRAAIEWVLFNGMFHALALTGTRVSHVRYEDLVDRPRPTLAGLAAARAETGEELAFVDGSRVTLGVDHTVAGNPIRFSQGDLDLRRDEKWRTEMPRRDRRLVSLIAAPLLRAYGYRVWGP
jgi:hypothetical protein